MPSHAWRNAHSSSARKRGCLSDVLTLLQLFRVRVLKVQVANVEPAVAFERLPYRKCWNSTAWIFLNCWVGVEIVFVIFVYECLLGLDPL